MFELFERAKQEALFAQRFDYEGIEYSIVQSLEAKRPLVDGENEPATWVFACKVSDGVPAPVMIVPCHIEPIWKRLVAEAQAAKEQK